MNKIIITLALSILVISLSGCSQSETGKMIVRDAWARSGSMGQNSAIYLNIDNTSGSEDSLHSANCQVAKTIELHKTMQGSDGMMSMHPQEEVLIPAGGIISFEPGGLHVMLIGLTQDLVPDSTFPLDLEFKNAGKLTVQIEVRQP